MNAIRHFDRLCNLSKFRLVFGQPCGLIHSRLIIASSISSRQNQSTSSAGISAAQDAATVAHNNPFRLVGPQLDTLIQDIHSELENHLEEDTNKELSSLAKYYFDGKGKALRPVIALCTAHAFNKHTNTSDPKVLENQRQVALISEMIHTASLVHDDILDHAETRRGKDSVNIRWNLQKSTMAGDYILAVGSKLLAKTNNPQVIEILSQVLSDLVEGEFMQLQNKEDESERFEHYLNKSFNKTASLMAYSCKANAVLAGATKQDVENSYQYGRNIGIAFQLVDDLLDFVSSADQLGKPAAADLHLGLATAPVLFAARVHPELNILIQRRFAEPGDVEKAFQLVLDSSGLQETKDLAGSHCLKAVTALEHLTESDYKAGMINLCHQVLNRLK
eukprot:TRINITY_DN5703_c0_g1_i12.p1 TRINITY_DN5703_c0_g1~~TRINITY_DN5703_c0_g1_i12.p1  ORF type:complete len:391 (-),score=106.99 TRINITY_DN5703_c0_g1_i12:428-1600(-)